MDPTAGQEFQHVQSKKGKIYTKGDLLICRDVGPDRNSIVRLDIHTRGTEKVLYTLDRIMGKDRQTPGSRVTATHTLGSRALRQTEPCSKQFPCQLEVGYSKTTM